MPKLKMVFMKQRHYITKEASAKTLLMAKLKRKEVIIVLLALIKME